MGITYNGTGGGVPRKTAKIFAKNAANADMTVFGSTLAGNTVYTQDLDSIQSSHYEVGWREGVISDLNYPLMSDMNAVQKTLSQQIAYGLQHGIPEWDAGTTYYAYDIVQSGGILYTSIIDNNTNNAVGDTTKWAVYYNPYYFLNKMQITNCILEAQKNALGEVEVATYSGSTITVKAGLKVLIPNGLNADGTLNNIEYTLPADTTYTYTISEQKMLDLITLDSNGNLDRSMTNFTFVVQKYVNMPTFNAQMLCYVEAENQWYSTSNSGSTWSKVYLVPILLCDVDGSNQITYLEESKPLKILTDSITDKKLYMTNISYPSNYRFVYLDWTGATNVDYIAPANGYFELWRNANATTDFICLQQKLADGSQGISTVANSTNPVSSYMHIFLPAQKGTKVTLTFQGTGIVQSWRFVYAIGEE